MKLNKTAAMAIILFLSLNGSAESTGMKKDPLKVKARKISAEDLKTINGTMLSIPLEPAAPCDAGNTNYVYTITNMLYGAEHFSAFVDPSACYVSTPGVVKATSINIILYATADIINCSGFEIQAHIEAAEWSGSCPSPGYEAQCTSDYSVMQITSPGLYLISFPLNEDCLRFGPFFASITFFNDAGCLPGPLNIVVDDWPEYCNSFNNYDGTWYDIVASYGLVGKLSLYATVEGLDPTPSIVSIDDVPHDQGGKLIVKWRKSILDSTLFASVTHYSIWRRLPENMESEPSTNDAYSPISDANTTNSIELDGKATRKNLYGHTWEWIANIPSHSFETYAYTVTSLFDSLGLDPHWQYFLVTACTDDPFLYWDSPVDSGYSVDNLPPAPPEEIQASEIQPGGGLLISWNGSDDEDLKCYNVYRGNETDFTPSPDNQVASTRDTFYIDGAWRSSSNVCYKIVSEDVHGNLSDPSILTPEDIEVGTTLISYTAQITGEGIKVEWKTSLVIDRYTIRRKENMNPFTTLTPKIIESVTGEYRFIDSDVVPGSTYRYRINYIDEAGKERLLFETSDIQAPMRVMSLFQNHPNPFNPSTTIEFFLPHYSSVTLSIFNTSGELVRELISHRGMPEGRHYVTWDGKDGSGGEVSSGVYYYRIRTERGCITRKMVLIR